MCWFSRRTSERKEDEMRALTGFVNGGPTTNDDVDLYQEEEEEEIRRSFEKGAGCRHRQLQHATNRILSTYLLSSASSQFSFSAKPASNVAV